MKRSNETTPKAIRYYAVGDLDARRWIYNEDEEGFAQPYSNATRHMAVIASISNIYPSQSKPESFVGDIEKYLLMESPRKVCTHGIKQLPNSEIFIFGQLEVGPRRGIGHSLTAIFPHDCLPDGNYIVDHNGRHEAKIINLEKRQFYALDLEIKKVLFKFHEYEDELNDFYMSLWGGNLKRNESLGIYKVP